jgi:predicted DNA binding protein
MPRVQLKINAAAEEDWLATVSTEFPDAEFRVLASHPTHDGLLGIADVTTSDADTLVREFDGAPEVRSYEVVHTDEQTLLIQYVIPMPGSYEALRASGNLPRFPAVMQNGWLHTEMTASHERLAEFTDELTAEDIPYEIQSLTQSYDPIDLLTDRQRKFITEAVERGYYDSPRGCTLTELAGRFEVAKSAASGILHRGEGRIIKQFVTESAA